MAYFPMFIDISGKPCLVVGGGRVALRKVQVLLDFEADVTVVAENICEELNTELSKNICEKLPAELPQKRSAGKILRRKFEPADCIGKFLVIAATDDDELNRQIAEICREQGIPVNVVDCLESSDFIFPSYVKEQNLVAAFSSSGKSPVMTQYLKEQEKQVLTPFLGEANELLGTWRIRVQEQISGEKLRRQAFAEILATCLETQKLPDEQQMTDILAKYSKMQ